MHDIDQILTVGKQTLTLIHLNIRSLPSHHEDSEALVDNIDSPLIIGLAETWLQSHNKDIFSTLLFHICRVEKEKRRRTPLQVKDCFHCSE